MKLQSLVFCSDEKILRILRRVLGDLEITIDLCAEADTAIHKLTRQRYEAIIVDCADERTASQVLRSARTAPCNKRAVAVAVLDATGAMRSAFEQGAHFVLYKPLTNEKAKASFRAARALMKCERRRNTRIPIEIPVAIAFAEGKDPQRSVTSDIGEGGVAVQPAPASKHPGPMTVALTLPGTEYKIECVGEVAWANSNRQAGLRFVDLSSEGRHQLKSWLDSHAPDLEKDDPPVACKLTDLSAGGGYLETASPFPVRALVTLAIRIAAVKAEVDGIVRVAHPEKGMGIEFLQRTPPQRAQLDTFIQGLMNNPGAVPEIMVSPEGLDGEDPASAPPVVEAGDDPLLHLFRKKSALPVDAFLSEMRQQRGPGATESASPA